MGSLVVLTVRELIDRYCAESGECPRREDARHARWWIERLGKEPVTALTMERIGSTLEHLASYGRSPSTVAFYLRFLRRVTAWGTACAYLPGDPCAGMALPKERTPDLRVLTEEEERKLCSALGHPYALWVRLAILTGLKQSEQFTLRWRDVDLDRATLLLPHPTTGGLSVVSLEAAAVTILRQLRQNQRPSLWVFPDLKNPFRAVNVHAFYVGRWGPAVHQAGIPWIAWKDLRHTRGVRLAHQGVPIHDITKHLRHRETRHAYLYRAWRPGQPILRRPVRRAPPPVFIDLGEGELQRTLLREDPDAPMTLGEACRLYALHHLKRRPSRPQFDRIYRQFFGWWKDRSLGSLTRREVRAWYAGLAHTPHHANKALTFLKCVFNWALDMELITSGNPTLRIKRYQETQRERFLSVEEVQRFMEGLPHLPAKQRAYLLLLLLTGARKSEARMMRWTDLDEHHRLWKKPRTKNGASHVVPLPVQVMAALQELPRCSPWVFPGQRDRPWSAATVDKFWHVTRSRWGLDDVHLHDLRRSCASYLAISGENLPTIQNVLNHRSLAPTAIYARLNTQAVDRALQRQADQLCRLTGHTGDSEASRPRLQLIPPDPPVVPKMSHESNEWLPRLLEAAWRKLPELAQARYTDTAATLGLPVLHLLEEAVDWHLGNLEKAYGLS